nr:hypothetical protein [Tanacetum cinerariifolium]
MCTLAGQYHESAVCSHVVNVSDFANAYFADIVSKLSCGLKLSILGADDGWQSVSLIEIITTAAIRKPHKKASLCVHPDKLQQRGASIQQKCICEKIFHSLKASWNIFTLE